ncbi:hypothetical protein [Sporosalibacterium faouarense]|uniref:hypothetical protein n=1 Tax=Sporosalibacterium faouarense TaxID=516123 RepID=UPI00192AE413|nr:hypothetical protein [Sporosalibacterium faouarense]
MIFFKSLVKLCKRKKNNGYYEASDILTRKEKNSIVIALGTISIPLFISALFLIIN